MPGESGENHDKTTAPEPHTGLQSKGSKHWLTSPKRKELFGPLGVTNIRTFVDPQNPNRAAVMMDVPDMNAMMAAMQTKAAADAMASDGVVPESLVILVES